MFHSVEHALNVAYYSQIKAPYRSPAMNNVRGKTATGEAVTWEDKAAEAGMIFNIIREQLDANDLQFIDAWKITPETVRLENRKITAIESVTDHLKDRINVDRRYLFTVIASHFGLKSKKSDHEWARELKVSYRMIRKYRSGWRDKPGVSGILEETEARILNRLEWRFNELGWIGE